MIHFNTSYFICNIYSCIYGIALHCCHKQESLLFKGNPIAISNDNNVADQVHENNLHIE